MTDQDPIRARAIALEDAANLDRNAAGILRRYPGDAHCAREERAERLLVMTPGATLETCAAALLRASLAVTPQLSAEAGAQEAPSAGEKGGRMTRDDDTQAHAAACCVGGVVEWTTPGLRTHGPFLGCDLIAGADDAREGG